MKEEAAKKILWGFFYGSDRVHMNTFDPGSDLSVKTVLANIHGMAGNLIKEPKNVMV